MTPPPPTETAPATAGDAPWSSDWSSDAQRRRLVRLCTTLTGDAAAAEDLAQETLVTAWRLRDRLVDTTGATRWLDAIARNVCHRHRTASARRLAHEMPGADLVEPEAHDPLVDLLERDELVALLDRALGKLARETREALVARYAEELAPGEIARRTGASPDAVSMRLVRGRNRLRQLLEDELADDPAAAVWIARHGTAWRTTRLRCARCGTAGVEHRRDRVRGVIELRCRRCGPDIASAYALDNPTLGPLLADVHRPSAVVARMASWSASYWPVDGSGTVACTRCAAPVHVTPYERAGGLDDREARGWQARCDACGELQTTSLAAVALLRPETRALRDRRPGTREVPSRRETRDGTEVVVVGFRDSTSGEGVDVHFSAGADARLLAVVAG